ncbi:hypothetical protein [Streptomyces sp. CB01881]|uniref:hypothetical protein n=1 Tax=Streptomyces sp. CB01881 TaxID=2078691 RepID=UPI000CDC20C4|nr:hypothetical protein [Streptomyces sp. CB01881]AUY53367.1 hypothetical protein C2142_35745 [Streptomyces sp. CB01881]TYC69519.1 hypothetical protein EH183_35805 [Streptomyces sp. CB01881]
MSWSDTGGRGDVSGHGLGERPVDSEEEHELRVLLQRAAPHLTAPTDRMDRIRERADRTRRRRRTAALAAGLTTGLVAAALAAAPALAPGHPADALHPATGTPPLAGAPSATAPTLATDAPSPGPTVLPSASPSTSLPPGGRPLWFPDIGGVIVDLPAGWSSAVVPAAEPLASTGYVASEPFGTKAPCPPQQAGCGPLGRITEGGALVTLTLVDNLDAAGKPSGGMAEVETEVDKTCGLRGGTRELVGHRIVLVANRVATVELIGCMNRPAPETVQLVQQVFETVRTTGVASAAPGSTRR